jgi:hypothetical protein
MSKIILKLVIRFIIFEQSINSYSRSVVYFVQSAVRLKYSDTVGQILATGRVNAVPNAYQPEMNHFHANHLLRSRNTCSPKHVLLCQYVITYFYLWLTARVHKFSKHLEATRKF